MKTTSIAVSVFAYFLWIKVIPQWKGYELRPVIEKLEDGAQATRLVKVRKEEVEEWDRTHDELGQIVDSESKRVVQPQTYVY